MRFAALFTADDKRNVNPVFAFSLLTFDIM